MRMEDLDVDLAQVAREPQQPQRVRQAATAPATECGHTTLLHVGAQPVCHRAQSREVHVVPRSVVPQGQLREEAAGVVVLCKVQ